MTSPVITRFRPYLAALDENIERYLIFVFYTYILLIVVVEVFRRFVLNISGFWTEKSALQMFLYLTWIGASYGIKERMHIRIDLLYSYLSDRKVDYLYVFSDVVVLATVVFILTNFYSIWIGSIREETMTAGIELPKYFFTFSVVFGFGLMVVRSLQALYRDVTDIRNGRHVFRGEGFYAEVQREADAEAREGGD